MPGEADELLLSHQQREEEHFALLPPEAGRRDFFISPPDDLHLFLSSIYNRQFCPCLEADSFTRTPACCRGVAQTCVSQVPAGHLQHPQE